MLAHKIIFGPLASSNLTAAASAAARVIVGPKSFLSPTGPRWNDVSKMIETMMPALHKDVVSGYLCPFGMQPPKTNCAPPTSITRWIKVSDTQHVPFVFSEFDNTLSRNLGVVRGDNIQTAIKASVPACGEVLLSLFVDKIDQLAPTALAVAKSFFSYSRKTSVSNSLQRNIYVDFIVPQGHQIPYLQLQVLADAVRSCQALVDMPCSEMHCGSLVERAQQVAKSLKSECTDFDVSIEVIDGKALESRGFGGICGVGRASLHPPALVILTRSPSKSTPSDNGPRPVALVGKGIMFDTGGLSLKPTNSMCSMKHDMGGAAAVLCAFDAIVRNKTTPQRRVYALLCVAENAIGPSAYRNDDILTMYSGKTVEINNTDAEGRLVLADGVAYASKDLKDVGNIITIATLTGAQMVCTGMKHAAILASSDELEKIALSAAQTSGDLAFPILYAPEFLRSEFESQVADMKNSVKDRNNASSSAAGHFIESNISEDYKGGFLHFDIAGPSSSKDRATGFGVALLEELVKKLN